MMKRKHSEMRENPHSEKGAKKKASGYLGDPRLLPRIELYLQSQKNKRIVSVISMADDLQARYSEYGRKKKNFFRKTVEKAYETYCAQLAKDAGHARDSASNLEKKHLQKLNKNQEMSSGDDSDSEASFSDENPAYVEYKDTNSMNSFMTQMYKSKRPLGLGSGTSTPQTQPSSPLRSADDDPKAFATSSRPLKTRSCPSSPKRPWHSDAGNEMDDLPFVIDRVGSGRNASTSDNEKPAGSPKVKHKDGAMSPISKLRREGVIQSPRSKLRPSSPSARMLSTVAEDAAAENEDVIVIPDDTVSGRSTPVVVAQTEPITSHDDSLIVDTGQPASRPASPVKEKSTRKVKKKSALSEREVKKKGPEVQQSTVKFADVGGNEGTLKEVCKLLVHMKHPEVYTALGVTPPRGFLLHGPPGCGKTLLAHAIAGELEVAFIKLAATEIVSGVSGESEEKLRDIFDKAVESAPCVLFLDEIDAITPKRETASKDMERRIVSQLLTCMDELASKTNAHVLVIGATNRPDSLDPALRRAGRFDREISMGIPDESARMRILQVLCRGLRLSEDFDFTGLAHLTPGFVGADLMALTREAAITAVNRVFTSLQNQHPSSSLDIIQPEKSECIPIDSARATAQCPSNQQPEVDTVTSSSMNSCICQEESDISRTLNVDGGGPIDQSVLDESQRPEFINSQKTDVRNSGESMQSGNVGNVQSSESAADVCLESPRTMQGLTDIDNPLLHATAGLPKEGPEDNMAVSSLGHETCSAMEVETNKGVIQMDAKPDILLQKQNELNAVLKWLKDQPPLTSEQLASLWIEMADFQEALKVVQPSAKREGFATIPDTTWDDIGALRDVRDELQMAIMAPVQHPEYFKSLGLNSPPGILLAGPPGCGKTLLAKAIANESGINFISVKGPELLNMYVGESERAVRQVFQRARNSAPCVIFFDEIDALCPRRSNSGEGGSSVRVVNQLLTEMDGLEERKQVFIMAATNRPDIIDPAILRPGRLDKTLHVGLPTPADRHDILVTITKDGKKPLLSSDVSLQAIAEEERLNGFTGADLAALVREASVSALREFMTSSMHLLKSSAKNQPPQAIPVHQRHFDLALSKVKASVTSKDQLLYEKMRLSRS